MKPELPPHLTAVLRLVVRGYSHQAIADELNHTPATVHTYIRNLKEWFKDEPEMQDARFSPVTALVVIGQRYFQYHNPISSRADENSGREHHSLDTAQSLLDTLQQSLQFKIHPDRYDYYASLYYRVDYTAIDTLQPRLHSVIQWLLQEKGLVRDILLTELIALLTHYSNFRGYYRLRVRLALESAQAAYLLERKTIEGWLRCDTLPMTLMTQFTNPLAARQQLERGQQLARELHNADMLGISMAMLAQTHLLCGDIREAETCINDALSNNASLIVQARIHNTAGEIAFAQRQFDRAYEHYAQAGRIHPMDFGPKVNIGKVYIAAHEAKYAIELFTPLLAETPSRWQLQHKVAIVNFELARALQVDGDVLAAKQYARTATHTLRTVHGYPQLKQFKREVKRFVAELSA